MQVRCPQCHTPIDLADEGTLSNISCPSCGSCFSLIGEDETTAYESTKTIGHFGLIEQVGAGTFGSVWRAKDTELDRIVAIKIPRKGQLDPTETEYFLREARAAAQLRHPNIVRVHEVGREDDTPYIVNDYVEGLTLADWLTGQQMTSREAAELCKKIAEALHHAHEVGVIHRDLKPGNIMLDADGEPHIMDFGLARREAGEVTMTVDGKVLGTPGYMSPEQAKGAAHSADRRSDVYSLGVILFELFTGERPFRGNTRMVLHQVINEEPPSPRRLNASIPRDLDTICLTCLNKEAGKRYGSAEQLAEDIGRFLQGNPIHARPVSQATRAWKWCKRNPMASVAVSLAFVLAIGGPIAALHLNRLASQDRTLRFRAEQLARVAVAHQLSLQSQQMLEDTPQRGLLLAAEAVHILQQESQPVPGDVRQALVDGLHAVGGRPITGHKGGVSAVVFSNDLRWFVTGSTDGAVRLWEFDERGLVGNATVLWQQHGAIMDLALSPDGRWLAAASGSRLATDGHWLASGDYASCLWDLSSDNPGSTRLLLRGHTASVNCVAFSPDNRWLATAAMDGTARIWDLQAEDPARSSTVLTGNSVSAFVAFSPTGQWVVTEGKDTVRLWDLRTGSISNTPVVLRGHESYITSMSFSPDGRWLATASADATARLWDMEDPSATATVLRGHLDEVRCMTFSPDGSWLATGNEDGSALLWKLSRNADEISSIALAGHDLPIRRIAFTPDGHWMVSGGGDSSIRLWDMRADNPADTGVPLRGHDDGIWALTCGPNSRWLLTCSQDQTARLWDLFTLGDSSLLLPGKETGQTVAVSADGNWLARGGNDNTLRLWSLTKEGSLDTLRRLSLPGALASVTFGPNGRWLFAGTRDGAAVCDLEVANLDKGKRILDHHNGVPLPVFSPKGHWLATHALDKWIGVYDLTDECLSKTKVRVSVQAESNIGIVQFSPDERWMVATQIEGPSGLWKIEKGQFSGPVVLKGHTQLVVRAVFSHDSRWLATGSHDHTACVWDLTAANPADAVVTLAGHRDKVHGLEFSPDSRWLATGSYDRTVCLWDLDSEAPSEKPLVLRGHTGPVIELQFSPTGRWLVTHALDNAFRLWDLTAGNPTDSGIALLGPERLFSGMRISPDGHWLIGISMEDFTARVWDLTEEQPVNTSYVLRGHNRLIRYSAITSDGRWLFTGCEAGDVRRWHLRLADLVAQAREEAGRSLTGDERRQFLANLP